MHEKQPLPLQTLLGDLIRWDQQSSINPGHGWRGNNLYTQSLLWHLIKYNVIVNGVQMGTELLVCNNKTRNITICGNIKSDDINGTPGCVARQILDFGLADDKTTIILSYMKPPSVLWCLVLLYTTHIFIKITVTAMYRYHFLLPKQFFITQHYVAFNFNSNLAKDVKP